jgi:hypothetical protein
MRVLFSNILQTALRHHAAILQSASNCKLDLCNFLAKKMHKWVFKYHEKHMNELFYGIFRTNIYLPLN